MDPAGTVATVLLERGSGYFLTTASAAGIVSQIGSAPYAVTKHAAVAFAEWLSITYGDARHRRQLPVPDGRQHAAADGRRTARRRGRRRRRAVLEPEEVADAVVDGLRDERFLILPHPEVVEYFQRKAADYDRWLAGMRRLQARVESIATRRPSAISTVPVARSSQRRRARP